MPGAFLVTVGRAGHPAGAYRWE